MDAVVTVVDAAALAEAARQVIAEVEFSDPSSDVDLAEQARAAVRDSLADSALWAIDLGGVLDVPV